MASSHVGLSKVEFGGMVGAAFAFERHLKDMHAWSQKGLGLSEEEIKQKKEKVDAILKHADVFKEKHREHLHKQYNSLDDHTVIAHLNEIFRVLHFWDEHSDSHDQYDFTSQYNTHRHKYGAHTSTLANMNAWYRNPRYRSKKNKNTDKNKDKHAGGADEPPSSKPKRTRKRKGKDGAEHAARKEAGLPQVDNEAVGVHPIPQAASLQGLLRRLTTA